MELLFIGILGLIGIALLLLLFTGNKSTVQGTGDRAERTRDKSDEQSPVKNVVERLRNRSNAETIRTRTEKIRAETEEEKAVAEAKEAQAHTEDTAERIRNERELRDAYYQTVLATLGNAKAVADTASQAGLSPSAYEQMVLKNMELVAQIVGQLLAPNIELQTYKAKREIDFDFEKLAAELAKSMAKVKTMMPLLQLNELHKQFSGILHEIELAKQMPEGERKTAELNRLHGRKKAFEMEIDQRQGTGDPKKNNAQPEFKFDDDEDV